MDASLMTVDELWQLLQEKRKEEEELRIQLERAKREEEEKIVKIGYLNQDFYEFANGENIFHVSNYIEDDCFIKGEISNLVEKFQSQFNVAVKKGTKFVCRVYGTDESWSEEDETNSVLDDMEADWARQYLENIKVL